MADMNVQLESSTSENTSAPSSTMANTNLQGKVHSADPEASRKAVEKYLRDVGILRPSDASTQLTTPKPVKEPATLMSLPGELRNRIYRNYFASQGTALGGQGERRLHHMHPDDVDHLREQHGCSCGSGNPRSGRMLDVNLLFTCKKVYHVARHIFFEERLVQVQMHGNCHHYVEQALRWALRLELCLEWWNSSPASPRDFLRSWKQETN